MSDVLKGDRLIEFLKKVPEWDHEGNTITKTFEFDDFTEAMEFVNTVAEIADEEGHHPDIDIRYNQVVLTLTTHDVGGLTENDFAIARKVDNLLD